MKRPFPNALYLLCRVLAAASAALLLTTSAFAGELDEGDRGMMQLVEITKTDPPRCEGHRSTDMTELRSNEK